MVRARLRERLLRMPGVGVLCCDVVWARVVRVNVWGMPVVIETDATLGWVGFIMSPTRNDALLIWEFG